MRTFPLLLTALSLPLAAQTPVLEALQSGKVSFEARTRYEHVEDSNLKAPASSLNANALTHRTFLGFETGSWEGLKAVFQAANVTALGSERFNSGLNNRTQFATVQDPGNTEVLQAHLAWKGFKLGRQTLRVDNQRFLGAGMWSQMPKAYTGLTFQGSFDVKGFELHAGHLTQVTDGLSRTRALKLDFARAKFSPAKGIHLSAFWFGNEETTRLYGATPDASVQHHGVRADGAWKRLLFDASLARQQAYKASKTTASRSYLSLMAGCAFTKDLSLKAGHEVLEGAARTDALQTAFTTPQASLHGFYGWADRLGTTPVAGIVDDYLQFEAKRWGLAFDVQFHTLKPEQTDRGYSKYGTDLSLSVTWPVTKHYELMFKFADYKGEKQAAGVTMPSALDKDLQKVWLVSTFKF